MNISTLLGIVSSLLTIISVVAGTKWKKYKRKARELEDLLGSVNDAIEDDRITMDEAKEIEENIKELLS